MYICICKGIKETDFKEKLQVAPKNPCGFQDICNQMGLGSDCGSCKAMAESYLQEMSNDQELEIQAQEFLYKACGKGK